MPTPRWTSADLPDLHDQIIVVTGASSGIGLETARALAGAGARVVLAVRNPAKATALAAQIRGETEVRHLDVSDLTSVRDFSDGWQGPLDALINNAGIMAGPQRRSADGFELQFATNHLRPFLLTTLLLPSITNRVVTVSSQLHSRARLDLQDPNGGERPYNPQIAYANSKLANVLFTSELQRRLIDARSGVNAYAAHPGIARTNLSKEAGGSAAVFDRVAGRFFNDATRGALATQFAATQDIAGGSYVGPGGLGHLRGYPVVHEPSGQARDPELARELWVLSAELTGAPELRVRS